MNTGLVKHNILTIVSHYYMLDYFRVSCVQHITFTGLKKYLSHYVLRPMKIETDPCYITHSVTFVLLRSCKV